MRGAKNICIHREFHEVELNNINVYFFEELWSRKKSAFICFGKKVESKEYFSIRKK